MTWSQKQDREVIERYDLRECEECSAIIANDRRFGRLASMRSHTVCEACGFLDYPDQSLTLRCPECGRVFDLTNGSDAGEWFYGHDCEGGER